MKNIKLSNLNLLLITFSLSLGTFIQILDTSITNVAIPTIAGELGVSNDDGSWVITSFLISNAIVLPLTGWLTARFGAVRLFCWSTGLFSVTSWLCGFSTSLGMLMFFRVLQGAVSGSLIPLSQALLLRVYPEERKGEALGIWVMIVAASPVAGPILGGWITDNYNWRWIFYINVPLGFIAMFITHNILKNYETERKKLPIDVLGIVLLIIAVGTFQVMLDRGNDWDWFKSNAIIALGVISFIGFTYFTVWELVVDYPVVDFSFFQNRNFLFATIAMTVSYFIFFGVLVAQPLWLQESQGYTPFMAGVAVAPMGIFPLLFSKSIGKKMKDLNLRLTVTVAFILFSVSFFMSSNFTTHFMLEQILVQRLLQGAALTIWFSPLTALSISQIPQEQIASASGIFTFLRIVSGGGAGTALYVTMLSRRGIYHHARLAETATTYNPATAEYFKDLARHNIVGLPADQFMNDVVGQQAQMMAMNDIFWISAWLMLFMIPIVWLCKEQPSRAKLMHVAAE